MTVAAVLLYATHESALFDAAGRPACRRMVEAAWAGGATPIIVVAADPAGDVALALAGSPAVLAEPAPREGGPVAQIARGVAVAIAQVSETDAALVWPGRMAWVDAETVTTLIETHGVRREAVLRPAYGAELGWPALIPVDHARALAALPADLDPDQLIARLSEQFELAVVDSGDPGVVLDRQTPLDALPPYSGPPEPARRPPEWGAAAADALDESPLEGPALAPYGQAADETRD